MLSPYRALCVKQKEDDKDEEREHKSKLDVQFFSFKTFYYLVSIDIICLVYLVCFLLSTIFRDLQYISIVILQTHNDVYCDGVMFYIPCV